MRKLLLIFSSLLLLTASWAQATDTPLLRHLSVSPDGKQLAFSYQGDLWTMALPGGTPHRITIHESYEGKPVWSPDGQHIAFNGERYGNNDIFVIPAQGGTAQRITFHSAADQLTAWTAEGQLLFNSDRTYGNVEWEPAMYQVSAQGGTPARLLDAVGYNPVVSADGNFIAFEMGPCRVEREDYKGAANKEVWIYSKANASYHKLTSFEGQDYLPQWGAEKAVYFLSARSGRYNIWRQNISPDGQPQGSPEQLTSFADMGVRSFSLSRDGSTIALSRGNEYYTMNTDSKQLTPLSIMLSTDYRFDPVVRKTYSNKVSELSVSPNGKQSAFVIRGEVFVKTNDKEKSRSVNLSKHPYREQDLCWLNDSTVLFVSDRNGQKEIYLSHSADTEEGNLFRSLKHETVRLTQTSEGEHSLSLSPDGKKIAFQRGFGKLIVADIDPKGSLTNETVLFDDGWSTPSPASWSPDSKWIAYAKSDLDFNSEVYIQAADNSQEAVNVSMHPRGDYSPVWSADGSKLGFSSVRNNGDSDVWFVWLKKEDWEKTKADWEDDEEEPAKATVYHDARKDKKKGKKKGDEEEEKKATPVHIDFDGIYERLEQVTAFPGDESLIAFSKDGEKLFFTRSNPIKETREIYSVKWDGDEAKSIGSGKGLGNLQTDKEHKFLYFTDRGSINRIKLDGGKKEALPHTAKMAVNYPEERKQMFDEAWMAINNRFYDPEFHGYDWKVLRETYQPLALSASTQEDFRYMFNLMLGQLNASHMGMYRTEKRESTQKDRSGQLGIEVKPVEGGVAIVHVVAGTPADKQKSKLQEGDIITAINGESITASVNYYSLLTDLSNEKVLLQVKDQKGKTKEVVIRPANRLTEKLYEEWVSESRALVDRYSNGRLGYLHIEGMNWTSFERFERDLTAAGHGKEGIVIDVRYNGGGWTTDYLMAVLNVRQHAYTIPRGATPSIKDNHKDFQQHYPYGERLPFAAWTKPSIALCNESSYSNAEIFSHAYKGLGIGKLVGRPTFGAVISTGGTSLIDGALLRMPFRAWYTKSTGLNQELNGAVPDIVLDNAPDSRAKGEDEQLKRAVEELLKDLPSRGL